MLTNALLRIEHPVKALPPPFEEVVSTVWVLEIPIIESDFSSQILAVAAHIEDKKELIIEHGSNANLIVYLSGHFTGPILIPAALVMLASECGASVEVYNETIKT